MGDTLRVSDAQVAEIAMEAAKPMWRYTIVLEGRGKLF